MGDNTNTELRAAEFGSGYEYVGVLGANLPEPTESSSTYERTLYAITSSGTSRAEASGSLGFEINVPSGSPAFFGGIGNWQEGEVSGSWMTVQKPDGSYLNVATSPAAEGEVIMLPTQSAPDNAVLSFVVINPTPGTWRLEMGNASGTTPYQAIATTLPTSPQPITIMEETLGAIITQGAWETGARWDPACDLCKVAGYGLALLIAGASAATAAVVLSVESALVVATAGFLGVTAPVALGLLAGLLAMGTLAVDFVLTQLCTWVGVCD